MVIGRSCTEGSRSSLSEIPVKIIRLVLLIATDAGGLKVTLDCPCGAWCCCHRACNT